MRSNVTNPLKRCNTNADGALVIELHRIHGNGSIVVNADLIETIEATPDTVVTLVTKRRFIVEDPVDDIIARVIAYRSAIAGTIGVHGQDDVSAGARVVRAIKDEEQAA
ncbi:MAG: flagellar FlbD family protein [Thermoleophilia bacterium]|nr:flagellar FlbD family protein [Thermoleophilia bacterium]